MFDLNPGSLLQGGSSLGPLLASWLVWPILCGLLASRKGDTARGVKSGLFWGPIGLAMVLLMDPRYPCPTCGHKTLKQPHGEGARPVLSLDVPIPPPKAGPAALLTVEIPPPREAPHAVQTAAPAGAPTVAVERRESAALTKEDRERVIAAACAGYDAEEEARLRSWLNKE